MLLKEPTESQAKRSSVVIREDEKRCRAIAMALIERNRALNRDACEAVERAQRFIASLGGIWALEQRQRIAELIENYERHRRVLELFGANLPGFSDFIEIINSEDLDDNDTKAAIRRLARRLWPYLKNKAAQIRLGEVASIRKESPVSLLLNRYFPEAIRAVALEKQGDKRQRMRLRGCKFLKTRKGKVAEKKPSELPLVDLYFWFRKQVYRNVCESLLRGGDALDRTEAIKKENRDGEVSYKDVEEFSLDDSWLGNSVPEETDYVPDRDLLDFTDSLKRLCDRADLTRREKKFLEVSKNFSLPTSQTAKKLSISPTAARVSKHRIMRKLRLVSSS